MRSPIVLVVLAISLLVSLFTNAEAKSVTGDRVLVLLDDLADKDLYSRFWQSLQEDRPALLEKYGEFLYDHVIHFAYKSKDVAKHKSFSNVQLVKFVNDGGNLLVATGNDPSLAIRDLAAEFDVEYDASGTSVYDHKDSEHDLISTSRIDAPSSIIDGIKTPILYRGVGLSLGQIPLLNSILKAESTAFTSDSYSASIAGSDDVELVAAFQAKNSARASFSGSIDLFSDSFFEKKVEQTRPNGTAKRHVPSGNSQFVDELAKWTFQEKGVLKVVDHRHHKANETVQPEAYRIKDEIMYILEISEYVNDEWVPFKASDIQLELIMLDPYIRTTLKQAPVAPKHHYGRYTAHVRLPDVYGVFTFKVNYKRPGLTYILAEDVVALRPFRHNEYARFLTAAYPYYASVGSMIVGFVIFSAVWLSTWGGQELKNTKQKSH
ncbi:Dolichyl-diphosphooligosaccharide--protein glycosyltransferase subunit WBP1 [Zychaea mexicana]|uniref:Dolichyl-diphosphooligosaccharide--protein glycosyltransferase subunit WBP1 n=1 Tax=Zychaea mexicana TaxID=64656 RepID=UPI0022FF12AD|nr:Dolichyl-diphosphooligosaccharide--protein glycosyltransferase subunit WBP1 [Zychaea mexicana]KAI9499198.1 Dolichyl-diphosphooligosaccharide--protein glycosyltransferase subunit WBP1 [Zychaea mexicana]